MNLTAEFSGNEASKNSLRSNSPNKLRWLKQQALFFYFLHVPFTWLRWLLLVVICILPLAGLTHWMESMQYLALPEALTTIVNILGFVSAGILILTVFLVIFLLPAQVVHLVTSKQTLLLKSFRGAILAHVLVMPLLHSLVIATLFSVIANKPDSPHFINLFCLVFLLLSSFLHASIYGIQKSAAFPFLIGFMVPIYQYLAYKLNSVDWYLLFALSLVSWAIFTVWWLRWKPTVHRAALITETFSDPTKIQRMQGIFGQGVFSYLNFGLNKNIENLFDGLLLGRAKAPLRMMLMSIFMPLFMLAAMSISFAVLPFTSMNNFLEMGKKFNFMFVSMLVAMPAFQLTHILLNLKKSWLIFNGKREDFFGIFEALIIKQSLYQMVAVIGLIVATTYFVHASELQAKIIFLAIAFGMTEAFLIIYLQLFIYHASNARRGLLINLMHACNFFLMLPLSMTTSFLGEDVITKYLHIYLILLMIFFIIAIALRLIAKSKWQKIEFLRVS